LECLLPEKEKVALMESDSIISQEQYMSSWKLIQARVSPSQMHCSTVKTP
jgi:hypothetical protein